MIDSTMLQVTASTFTPSSSFAQLDWDCALQRAARPRYWTRSSLARIAACAASRRSARDGCYLRRYPCPHYVVSRPPLHAPVVEFHLRM